MSKSIYEESFNHLDELVDALANIEGSFLYRHYLDNIRLKLKQAQKQEKLLEKLVERDTPMLPIKLKWKNTENYYYVCPKCEEMVARDDEVFCQDCGQRLDWGKENE